MIEQLDILIKLDSKIWKITTGTPDEFTKQMSFSKSKLYKYFNLMKECGAPIKYCSRRCSYYYEYKYKTKELLNHPYCISVLQKNHKH